MRGLSRREFAESCPPPSTGRLPAAVSSACSVGCEHFGLEMQLEWENRTNLQLDKGESLSMLLEIEGSS